MTTATESVARYTKQRPYYCKTCRARVMLYTEEPLPRDWTMRERGQVWRSFTGATKTRKADYWCPDCEPGS